MENFKKVGAKILDFIEVIMPVVALLVIFFAFIANVISRYVMNAPLNACYELCLAGLVWCLLLSSPYAARKHNNIAFTLVYDLLGAKAQVVLHIVGTGFLIFCFAVMLYPSFDWIMFMSIRSTTVLKIPLSVIYCPYIVFNVLTLGHLLHDLIKDLIRVYNAVTGKAPLVKEENELISDAMELEGEAD